jgi:hypothetical protein
MVTALLPQCTLASQLGEQVRQLQAAQERGDDSLKVTLPLAY